jgi:hypothetical protein
MSPGLFLFYKKDYTGLRRIALIKLHGLIAVTTVTLVTGCYTCYSCYSIRIL